jgi:hypothetical protein
MEVADSLLLRVIADFARLGQNTAAGSDLFASVHGSAHNQA